jgi:fibronectin-binding autotransporter adhesin
MKTQNLRCGGTRGRLIALGMFAPVCNLQAANGTWNVNAPGNWGTTSNWTGGVIASGSAAIADFSTLDITGDHAVNIEAPYTIGTLNVGDLTTLSNSWQFTGVGPLTLDNGGSQPVLHVPNRTPLISAPLAGTNGLSKTGAGFITLSGNNSALSGVLNLQNVTGTNGSGLGLSGTQALGGITTINVNGTATTGPYLSLSNNITIGSGVTINLTSQGGNSGPPGAIRSEGGNTVTNIINGPINVNGAGVRIGNNNSKLLELNGVITGGANGVTFRTSVNDGIHVTNTGNSWSGIATHSEGILWFKPGTLPAASPLVIAASAGGTVHTSGTFNRALGVGAGEVRLGGAETSVNNRPLGLSARGGDLSVNFGGAGAEVFFNNFTTNTTGTPSTINTNIFVLNGAQANGKLTLANPINLNGAARTLQLENNTVELTGGLRGGAFTYTKTGAATLLLPSASTWLGDLTFGSAADSVNGGIIRATHAEAFGAPATPKNINAQGNNRGTSVVELDNNITIDSSKTLRMWGKNFAMTGSTGSGQQQSLRNVSGSNQWDGSLLIAAIGGSYAMESAAGTLTVGANAATTSVIRNDVASSTRTMSLYGPGHFVINNKLADNGNSNLVLTKSGSGNLTITRTDNDFDTAPNLLAGSTEISSLTNAGIASSLGLGTSFNLGATLRYVGTGDSSDRTLSLWPNGGTLDSSGTGPLVLSSPTFNHNAGIAATIAAPFALGATDLVLNETAGIAIGQTIAGTGVPANTTVSAVNPDTRTVTLSQPTSAASTVGVAITIGAPANISRTLTLTGSNSGNNSLAAPLANASATGLLSVNKTGSGTWILNGSSHTYTGATTVSQGTLGFDGAFPADSDFTVAAPATLSLANLSLRVDPDTNRALDIDGTLAITGPVSIVLPEASPSGSQIVLDYGSITGAANLTSNYRGSAFTPGATSASLSVGAGVPLTWTGDIDNIWDTKTTTNWKNAANVAQTFFWGDPVRFDDSGSIAPFVTMTGELRPASLTVDTDSVEYFLEGTGTLTGPFPLTKTGSSIFNLGGANSFSGGITVNEGLLRVLGPQSLGAIGQDITVASGAALDTNGFTNSNRDYDLIIAGTGTDGTGAVINSTGINNTNGFGSLSLSGNATIGGTGRWDVRPITAGFGFIDPAGFTLTKVGTNLIGFIDGTLLETGDINVNEGTLAFTRMVVNPGGMVNVNTGALLQFENYTSGSFARDIALNNGSIRLQGSNLNSPSSVAITGTATFDVEAARTLTFTGAVTGTGDLVKSANTGGLTLTGTNTYDGTTTINAGTLVIGSQISTGTLGDGAVTNNGSLVINRSDTAYVVSNPIGGSGSVTIGQGNGGAFNSLVTLTGANTFTGNVAVNSGGLKIFNPGALGTGPKLVTLTNGTNGRPQLYLDGSGGNITLPADMSFLTSSTNTLEPAIGNLAGNNVVSGPITMTTGGGSTAVSVFGGTLALNGNITADTSNRRLILGGTAGSGSVGGVISNGGANPVGLDKVGSVTWTLNGDNTYTGTTVVSEGKLLVNGNQGSSSGAVSVASGATLGGTGTIGGNLTTSTGSILAPGTSIGTLTTVAPVIVGGSLAIEVDAASSDRLTVGGTLDIGTATLDITALAAPAQTAYVIASYGVLTGTFSGVTGMPAGYSLNYNYNGLNQIALVQGGDAYGSFETANGISGAGSDTDSDGDGIPNGIEFVIGGDPSGPGSASNALLPTSTTDAAYLNVVFRRTDDSAPYNPFVEYGSTLGGWTPAQNTVNDVIVIVDDNFYDATTDRVTVRIPRTLASPDTKLFARLRVNIP